MKLIVLFSIVFLTLFQVKCENYVMGNVSNRVKLANVNQTRLEYNAIPFMKRVKQYFFSDPSNRLIQGIQILDNLHSKASINVTAGGVGYSYVNLRVKSERGRGLDYNVGIYVMDDFYH